MRAILIDWLLEVADEYTMMHDTVHVAVSVLDRYLTEHKELARNQLQAAGVASLIIAARCNESHAFGVKEAAWISDQTYSEEELKQWVAEIWKLFGLSPLVATSRSALTYLHTYTRRIGLEAPAETCAFYICDIALEFVDTLEFPLQNIAASAIEIARNSLGVVAIDWASMPCAPPTYACMEALTHMCNKEGSGLSGVKGLKAALPANKLYYGKAGMLNVSALKICMPSRDASAEPNFSGGGRVAVPMRNPIDDVSD
jgi:hypothetical protein